MRLIVPSSCARPAAALVFLALVSTGAVADETATDYRLPPPPLGDIVDTPPTPGVSLSPDRSWMLLMEHSFSF